MPYESFDLENETLRTKGLKCHGKQVGTQCLPGLPSPVLRGWTSRFTSGMGWRQRQKQTGTGCCEDAPSDAAAVVLHVVGSVHSRALALSAVCVVVVAAKSSSSC